MDDGPEATPHGDHPSNRPDDRPAIRLDNVLKLAGIAETGGQAKRMIQAGEVLVNGTVETRRKHMLHEGDEVEVGGESFVVELTSEDDLADDLDEEPGEHRGLGSLAAGLSPGPDAGTRPGHHPDGTTR